MMVKLTIMVKLFNRGFCKIFLMKITIIIVWMCYKQFVKQYIFPLENKNLLGINGKVF